MASMGGLVTQAEAQGGDPAGDRPWSGAGSLTRAAHASATSAALTNTQGTLAPAAPETEHSGT